MLTLAATAAMAQAGLNINALFDGRFRDSKQAKETCITGDMISSYGLTVFRSLELITDQKTAKEIEDKVVKDGSKAEMTETTFRDGRLYYGFYMLKPRNGLNRYIMYKCTHNSSRYKVSLIYMEGKASAAYVKALVD